MTQTRSDRRPAPERMKFFATGLLILVTAGYLLSRLFESRHPALSVCAAFCEAAMVGAMADWFAVVALFKHPMGVPIPHTAIIPRSKNRIADNLGTFISRNFLGADAILARIRAFDPAARFATWLGNRVAQPLDLAFWTEAALLSEAGIDAVVFGPGFIEQAHAADEYVDEAQLETAFQAFLTVFRGCLPAVSPGQGELTP